MRANACRVEIDDAYLGGERSGGKRGRGTPGKTPIIAAVETTLVTHNIGEFQRVPGLRIEDWE